MKRTQSCRVVVLMAVLVAGGCGGEERDAPRRADGTPPAAEGARPRAATPPPAPTPTAADSAAALRRLALERDSLLSAFARARRLSAREVAELRQDVNAEQIAIARELGVRASGAGPVERLRREGRLVPLGDSTVYWVLRDMDHSVPLATPDARAMLVHLGRRFHARLDSLGLPRYRFKITSALRTDESQAELRRANSNASRTLSAHEFGTTVDISHERFAAPAAAPEPLADLRVEMLEEVGREHARALQAELGRAIAELRDLGALRVMMENRQPVYHMTVARRFPSAALAGRE